MVRGIVRKDSEGNVGGDKEGEEEEGRERRRGNSLSKEGRRGGFTWVICRWPSPGGGHK